MPKFVFEVTGQIIVVAQSFDDAMKQINGRNEGSIHFRRARLCSDYVTINQYDLEITEFALTPRDIEEPSPVDPPAPSSPALESTVVSGTASTAVDGVG